MSIERRYIAQCDECLDTYQCGATTAREMAKAAKAKGWVTRKGELLCPECNVKAINEDLAAHYRGSP